ncbi:alpha/beta fold hydrolase [Polaromonas sp.]|uniref:alpha/beta fold hydrolase n=1 Tax=Polaromonas sp. TaxID=1869339 RepID=UPI003C829F4F
MSWVLLRGLTREARHWGTLPERLAHTLETDKVVTLDLPGNGVFHAQRSPASAHRMVDFARHQLQSQGVPPPWQLLAMSLGGMVAADWAQRYPREVARLVLINTSMRPFSTLTERLRPASWPQLATLAARWQDAPWAERAIHRLTCQETALREADIAAWVHIRQTAPVSLANAGRQLAAAARFSCAPQAPPCPVLVLSSSADRLVDPRCSQRLAAAWQASHQVHPWAGHDLPHDDAGWVCGRIAHWLART